MPRHGPAAADRRATRTPRMPMMGWPATHRPWTRRFVVWFCALSLLQPALAAMLPALLASSAPGWDSVCSVQTAASTPAGPGESPSSAHGGPHCVLCTPQVPLLDNLGASRLDVPMLPRAQVLAAARPAPPVAARPWRRPATRAPPARFSIC